MSAEGGRVRDWDGAEGKRESEGREENVRQREVGGCVGWWTDFMLIQKSIAVRVKLSEDTLHNFCRLCAGNGLPFCSCLRGISATFVAVL